MKSIVLTTAVAFVVCSGVSHAQMAKPAAPAPEEQSAPVAGGDPARDGLGDLEAMTFDCPKAGLNAAAREAAKVPSQGTYQFSYFKIITNAHHAAYEVHFKSNHRDEADLKYCVALYCQQGWDPKNTRITVTPIGSDRRHGPACGRTEPPVKPRATR